MDKKLFRSILRIITYAALLVLVLVNLEAILNGIGGVLNVLRPVLLGFVLAFVLNWPCTYFRKLYNRVLPARREKLAMPLAVLSSYVLLIVLIVVLLAFVIPQINNSILLFFSNLESGLNHLAVWINQVLTWLNPDESQTQILEQTLDIAKIFDSLSATIQNALTNLVSHLGNMVDQVIRFASNLVSVVVTGFLALVFSIYMLAGKDRLLSQCKRLLRLYAPARVAEPTIRVTSMAAEIFTRYVRGQVTEACILGGLCCVGMLILRLDYAPMVSVIIGVSALIPVAGAYIGAIVGALVLLLVAPMKALIFLIVRVCLQQVEGNVIDPRVVGTSIGLPGLWVLASVTVGGGLFGVWGIILAVPLVSLIYTLIQQDVRRRMGHDGVKEAEHAPVDQTDS